MIINLDKATELLNAGSVAEAVQTTRNVLATNADIQWTLDDAKTVHNFITKLPTITDQYYLTLYVTTGFVSKFNNSKLFDSSVFPEVFAYWAARVNDPEIQAIIKGENK
jgi:hypothetical protein